MVAKISVGSSLYGAIAYNGEKINEAQGRLLTTNRIYNDGSGTVDIGKAMEGFLTFLPPQMKIEKPVVHISLNPHPEDVLTDIELQNIAREYLEKLGFGNQPYLVFKHEDIDRHHLHIVTVNVDENGKLNTDLFTYRLQRADGTWEWFQEKSVYLGRTEGAPYRIVGVCQSIQNHKIVEQNLIAARDRAQESDRLKSAFLTNISHEIRTPLNAIVGFSNLLTHGDIAIDSSEGQEFVSLINTNSNQLLALISDVLDLSKIESGTMEYNFAECGLGRLLSDIYHNYLLDMRPDVRFDLMLPDEDMKITTDAVRLRQVLDHLLSNAAKFTFAGHIGLGYAIAADVRTVELFVEDTGCGIPEDKQRDIFKRFFKVDSFVQGAGLGLPICRTITERLGGTVSFVSRFGEGSRFAVTLPLDGES